MPDTPLTTEQVAVMAGVDPASIRTYRLRGTIPEPDGYLGRTPWWKRATIDRWLTERRTPGRPRGAA